MKPMYLVQLVHRMDDLPVYLSDDEDDAKGVAESLDWEPSAAIRQIFGHCTSEPVHIEIVTFGAEGRPIGRESVRIFDDEAGDGTNPLETKP